MMRDTDLVDEGRYVKCLEFIHDEFFTDLESAMSGVVEALTAFEEKCKYFSARDTPVLLLYSNDAKLDWIVAASDWSAKQKIEDIQKRWSEYLSSVFPTVESDSGTNAWVNLVETAQFKEKTAKHRSYELLSQTSLLHDITSSFRLCNEMRGEVCIWFLSCGNQVVTNAAGPSYFTLRCRWG